MSIPIVGEGFGRRYIPAVPRTETTEGRSELYYESIIGGDRVTLIIREDLAVEDPFDNMARASAYRVATGKIFPVPPVGREIKDYLIRTNLSL
jgi:hypothetical protein